MTFLMHFFSGYKVSSNLRIHLAYCFQVNETVLQVLNLIHSFDALCKLIIYSYRIMNYLYAVFLKLYVALVQFSMGCVCVAGVGHDLAVSQSSCLSLLS